MPDIRQHLDIGSQIIILITGILFVVALFVKGFGHDLLVEAAIFLVSAKLIVMAYKNSVSTKELTRRLDNLEEILARMERVIEGRPALDRR